MDFPRQEFWSGFFLRPRLNSCLLHWQADSLPLNHKGNLNLSIWNLYFSSYHNIIFMWISEFYNLHLLVILQFSQFSHTIVYDCLWPHGPQHARPLCPIINRQNLLKRMSIESVMPSNHLILCHPLLLPPLQSFPASGFYQMSQFLASGGQIIGISASASVLPMDIQDWFPLGWTGWISLLSKGLSRVFSNTKVQKHQFFSTWLSF